MKKKQKNAFANGVMGAVIILILAAGVLGAGYLRGWFGDRDAAAVLTDARGIVDLTRAGGMVLMDSKTHWFDNPVTGERDAFKFQSRNSHTYLASATLTYHF